MENFDYGMETERLLQWLGQFGPDPEGGMSRLLYKKSWVAAQQALAQHMRDNGFSVKYDAVGNLFGRIEGTEHPEETILTGSHVDTVKKGGLYDGALGIIGGLVALETLVKEYGKPKKSLELVSFAEEEGSRFPYVFWGSKNLFGLAKPSEVENITDFDGIPFVEAMSKAGFSFLAADFKPRTDLKAFLELHIEQGGVLEREKLPIGLVEAIVGQRRFTIKLKGEANHAGTTPMSYRRDAVYIFSKIECMIMEHAFAYGDPLVATVGKVEVTPNIVNVVPAEVLFTLDVRHTQKDKIVSFTDEVREKMQQIAKEANAEIEIDMWMDEDPVPLDPKIVDVLEEACKENGLSYRRMHSGAGHDSQIIAPRVPTAMLFVPSRAGISHNPAEYTHPADLGEGVKALRAALHALAY
ncbi:allantoate deiminase [Selenomonas sp. TAMA-11512]|uniref:allantoate deiminase n=1 Tax=Selenomonas sp. TAMA-11512 TaxID=3095337 RepID=UPI003092B8CE|nr:allantoate deiminase [Selenomonas sp. TAMA-11512]